MCGWKPLYLYEYKRKTFVKRIKVYNNNVSMFEILISDYHNCTRPSRYSDVINNMYISCLIIKVCILEINVLTNLNFTQIINTFRTRKKYFNRSSIKNLKH